VSEIKRFEDLKVWQRSHGLVLEVYKVTQQFPNEEKFGLLNWQNAKWTDKIPLRWCEGMRCEM